MILSEKPMDAVHHLDLVLGLLRKEFLRATTKHGTAFNSAHEGYAVILEELDEAWQEIKHGGREKALEEMVQVGAMAVRFIYDLGGDKP